MKYKKLSVRCFLFIFLLFIYFFKKYFQCTSGTELLLLYAHVNKYYYCSIPFSLNCYLQLQQSGLVAVDSEPTCCKLRGDLQAIFNELPKDMQELLVVNPQTAALLQECLGSPLVEGKVSPPTSPT